MDATTTEPRNVTLDADTIASLAAMPYADGVVALWNRILSDCGEPTLSDPACARIDPRRYAIPRAAWLELSQAWIDHAPDAERTGIAMHYVNVGPSAFDA